MCNVTEIVETSKSSESINEDAVLGAMSIGIGCNQMEELFATLQMKYMHHETHQRSEARCDTFLEACKKESLESAIQDEINLAIAANDIDENGNPCITVTLDGSWIRRAYKHNFNSIKEAAVINRARTKKVLFYGVRNKYCQICTYARGKNEEPRAHECNANWSGSSCAMESDILVEGLNWLLNEHGVCCTRVIGDGDSSVMTKIKENVSYGSRVQKLECTNHALRNFRKNLVKIAENTKAFPGKNGIKARQLLKEKAARLSAEERGIICSHAVTNPADITSEAIAKLRADIENVPLHVFGDHRKCNEERSCRQTPHLQQDNDVPLLRSVRNFFESIEEVSCRLAAMSNSLIYNLTSNAAESFMNLTAKVIGGKRIDFCKGKSYTRRVGVAALSYNTAGQGWHRQFFKARYHASPKSPLARLIRKRANRLQSSRQSARKRKLVFQDEMDGEDAPQRKRRVGLTTSEHAGLDYGKPDADPEQLEILCSNFYQTKVCVTLEQRQKIEEGTRSQGSGTPAEVDSWKKERAIRISASNAKKVSSRKPTTKSAALVKELLYKVEDIKTKAMQHGHVGERKAKQKYAELYGVVVEDCGLYIDIENPYLCASPDGIVRTPNEVYLLEVKSPYNARLLSIDAAIEKHGVKFPLKKDAQGNYFLPENHSHYCQIQLQLQCAGLERCDYIVFLDADMAVVSVPIGTETKLYRK